MQIYKYMGGSMVESVSLIESWVQIPSTPQKLKNK